MNSMVASCKWTIAVGLFITAILLAGCQSHENEKKYLLEGFVVSKDASKHSITISHGDIAGFMPAMTMSYEVRDSAAFKEIERGDMIKADLYVKNGSMDYWLENIQVTDRSRHGTVFEGQAHVLHPGEAISDIAMVNQDGKTIHLGQFKGKALLVTFIYTRCPLPTFCPRITSQFASIHDQLEKSSLVDQNMTHLLTISFDPEYDKPEVLRRYALAYMNNREDFSTWDFASPSPEDLKKLATAFGLQYYPEENQIAHSVATILISTDGKIVRVWPDNEWKTSDVLDALLSEARRELNKSMNMDASPEKAAI
jgi:protein SCO1/2